MNLLIRLQVAEVENYAPALRAKIFKNLLQEVGSEPIFDARVILLELIMSAETLIKPHSELKEPEQLAEANVWLRMRCQSQKFIFKSVTGFSSKMAPS